MVNSVVSWILLIVALLIISGQIYIIVKKESGE